MSLGYVTPRYASPVARSREDTGWSRARGAWERLAWARATDGRYPTAAEFARAVREKPHTYIAYERDPDGPTKSTKLDYSHAVAWADKLKVRWEWLLEGKGLPWPDDTDAGRNRPAARVAELVDAADPDEQERVLAVVQAMVGKRTGTEG